jgi:hypothetical protein
MSDLALANINFFLLFQEYMRIYNDQVADVRQSFDKSDLSAAEQAEIFTLIPPLFPQSYLETNFEKNLTRPCHQHSPIVISSDSDCADY